MDYDRLSLILKRYSFESKMKAAFQYSAVVMDLLSCISAEEMSNKLLPWNLETFTMLAVKAKEYQTQDILMKNQRYFFEIMRAINDYTASYKMTTAKDPVEKILMHCGLTQFDIQEDQLIKYYRYNWLFSYSDSEINIPQYFYENFHTTYERVWIFAVLINCFICQDQFSSGLITTLASDFKDVFRILCISRDQYIAELDKFSSSAEEYPFCVRPSYSYPFIEYKGVAHLPLPHLVYRAATASLLYRFTEGSSERRTRLGKILEAYLFNLLSSMEMYDEVVSESIYKFHGTESRTPDVMIKHHNQYLFLESKSMVPSNQVRVLNDYANECYANKIAKAMHQLYKQICLFRDGTYYGFNSPRENHICSENLWGIVCILEDAFCRRERIYNRFAEIACIDKASAEFEWAIHHIKAISLYDVEKHIFAGFNLIDELKTSQKNGHPYDLVFNEFVNKPITHPDVLNFRRSMKSTVILSGREFVERHSDSNNHFIFSEEPFLSLG